MKWLLILSLALLVRGDERPPPIIIDDNTTVIQVPSENLDPDSDFDESDLIVEPDQPSEIIYEDIRPQIPIELDGLENDTDDSEHVRKRRFIKTETTLWPNGEIIYSYTPTDYPTEDSKSAITFSIEYFSMRSCLNFTEVDQTTYTGSHVKFIKGNGCFADLGYKTYNTRCSCCSKGTCYHELLHLLGFMHEQQRPERDRYIEVDLYPIDTGKWSQFAKLAESQVNYTDKHIYKVASTMHYSSTAFRKDLFGYSIKTVNDDYIMAEGFFYPVREVNLRYQCAEKECPDFTTECVNDGYVTKYLGKCQCMCPDGLSPEDGCSKASTSGTFIDADWPSGSYAFVAAGSGCPVGFNIGNRKHWSAGFSWAQSTNNPMKGTQDYYSTQYEFCVSRNNFAESNNIWPAGVYCLHRVGGTCPSGFKSGSVQMDDYIRTTSSYYNNTKSGDLPDGVFNEDTKFEFCCRSDGMKNIPIDLPLTNEFILYNADNRSPDCQAVRNFNARKFYYGYNNHVVGGSSIATKSGSHPFMYSYSGVGTFLFYICHYTPMDLTCGGTIELDSNNPTGTFSTPNYPNNYNLNQKCSWLITAPEGSKVYLDFETFDVHCSDNVEVRVLNIGEQHPRFCTHNGKTFRSYSNKMTVLFKSAQSTVASGFEGKVRYVTNEDNCYDFEDDGASYRGKTNISKYFEPCLPWSETGHCEYSSQHPKDATNGLDSNYCRNPGSAERPWCYVEATECKRRVCDVCLEGKVHDTYSDCQTLISTVPNFCAQDNRAASICRASCIADHPLPAKPASKSSVSCSPPSTVPFDGTSTDPVKASYDVGDTITYTCNDNPDSSVTMICGIDGVFDGFLSACKMCNDTWLALNGICYYRDPQARNYYNALSTCASKGAKLIMPKGKVAVDFLASNRNERETWIGANDLATEGVWKWLDNSLVAQEDIYFGAGQPSNASSGSDCAALLSIRNSYIWVDKICNAYYYYYNTICQIPARSGTCKDVVSDCAARASLDSQFCEPSNGFSSLFCRGYCGCEQECGNGGQLYKGQCYYKQSDTKKGREAKNACNSINGVLPTAKTPTDYEFVKSLYSIQWLGLNDTQSESSFVWSDGTPLGSYNRWGSGYPNNFYNSDCVLSRYGYWYDQYCDYYNKVNYVCVKDEISKCNVPTASSNSIQITTGSTIHTHEELISECSPGYMLTSGDLRRYCLGDSSLSGSAPVCEDEISANVITPSNNVPLTSRGQKISTLQGYMFSGDKKNFEIPRAGEIVSWEYFSKQSGNVALMVFRYVGTNLKIVGFNYITTESSNTISSIYRVPIADRIDVEKGDRIGIWFPENKQVIEVNYHHDDLEWRYQDQQIRRSDSSYADTTALVIGSTYSFSTSDSSTTEAKVLYGLFSLRANIGPRT